MIQWFDPTKRNGVNAQGRVTQSQCDRGCPDESEPPTHGDCRFFVTRGYEGQCGISLFQSFYTVLKPSRQRRSHVVSISVICAVHCR